MRQAVLKAIAGFGVAFLILGLFTWRIGWGRILGVVARAEASLVVPGAILAFGSVLGVGIAWWLVVRGVAPMNAVEGVKVFFSAQFANAITPFGQLGGEPFIAYILARNTNTPIEESLGATVSADFLNTVPFFTYSLTGIVLFLLFNPNNHLITLLLKLILFLAILVTGFFLLLWYKEDVALGLLGRFGAWIDRLIDRMRLQNRWKFGRFDRTYFLEKGENFYHTLRRLMRQPRTIRNVLLVSHLANILGMVGMYFLLQGLGADISLPVVMFLLPAGLLASYLPLPGGLGGIEVALTLLLNTIGGVPFDIASAATLLFRVFTYWMVLLIGGYYSSKLSVDILARLF